MNTLNHLTIKNLKLNKSRTIVTIIGIMLSAALITVVAGIAVSAQKTMVKGEINFSGDYDLVLRENISSGDVEDIKANRYVSDAYVLDSVGTAKIPNAKEKTKPYAYIQELSKNAYTNCFNIPLKSGRYPQSSTEIVLSKTFVENSARKYKVGDSISFDIGERKTSGGETISNEYNYGEYFNKNENEFEIIKVKEHFQVQSQRTYKIVGLLDEYNTDALGVFGNKSISPVFTVPDEKHITQNSMLYVKYTDEGERNYLKTTSVITGVSEEHIKGYLADEYTLENGESKYGEFSVHTSLLSYKGYALSEESLKMLFYLAGIVIAIVIIASVFVIRNSFAISITEKTTLYGMLASVGATSRQIRRNVLFEGIVLALIGIPAGILLGVGVVAVLIWILNHLLGFALNGIAFEYSVSALAIVLAVVLSMLTILFSTLGSAIRASKIPPIDAVRGSRDIKIKKKQKAYKCPRLIKKLFGTGGEIAYKNLKRSRKKYRTTVISIVVSVAVFIAVSSFIQYGKEYSSKYFHEIDFNLLVTNSENFDSYREESAVYNKIGKLQGVKSKKIISTALLFLKNNSLSKNKLGDDEKYYPKNSDNSGEDAYSLQLLAVDDNLYKNVANELGLSYNEVKSKGVLINGFLYVSEEGEKEQGELFDPDKVNSLTLNTYRRSNNGENGDFDIEIAKTVKTPPKALKAYFADGFMTDSVYLIVSRDTLVENVDIEDTFSELYINGKNPEKLEEEIGQLKEGSTLYVENVERLMKMYNAMTLVISIFAYGFIIVISLIGITNIFNTITTNMRLRSKEFAMLKSIGMTKREFNRMIRLESLFYGVKSLIIGIPLGLLAGIGIFMAFSVNAVFDFVVPYGAILISVVFVFAVIWLIMKFSISKVQKQNIIETIRNDNI
ncbi:MAG: ABC transporter permease [Ruminococcus sp.]